MNSSIEPPELDVAIIACNNEATIGRTLESVRGLARRIVVVDSGSTDRTPEIVGRFGAEWIPHAWEGHVRQKQFALDQCSAPWVLCLDSDESLEPELYNAIRAVAERKPDRWAGYKVNRRVFFQGRWLRHAWQPEWRLRLVRRDRARWGGYDPHDRLEVSGPVGRLPGILRHDAFADTADLLRKQIGHGLRAAESYRAMGRRGSVAALAVSPTAAALKQLVLRFGWLDGWRGWVAAYGAGVNAAVKHMRLLELTRTDPAGDGAGPPPTIPTSRR